MPTKQRVLQALIKAEEHYDRMIGWVKTISNQRGRPDNGVMNNGIGESWDGENCPLCCIFPVSCYGKPGCPMVIQCGDMAWSCSLGNHPYGKINYSDTWSQWLFWAYRVRKLIR